jgi:hypothetical protein
MWMREVQCVLRWIDGRHLAVDSMSTTTRNCTCFPFLGSFPPSAISTKCKLLPYGISIPLHMIIVICLTHLFSFLTIAGRYQVVTLAEPRSRQLPTVSHFSHSVCGLVVCEPPKARRRHGRSNLIIRQLSALHGGDLSWAVPGLASSFMSCVLHLVICTTFFTYATAGRTETRPHSGRVCAALQQRAG